MEKTKNPFLIYGYDGPEYFCDRTEETAELVGALENGRNVALMSPRRMGKTGLIHNTFHRLAQSDPEVKCFYMDIFSTNSLAEFTQLFSQTVLGQLDTAGERWINRLPEFFKSCRPVISADPITGNPSVTLDFVADNAENTLREIFASIRESGKECIIAIEEFQQVSQYPEKGTEALLRSYIQFIPNARFIFSGSKRQLMNDMFSLPNRPFYQSTQKMNIDAIDCNAYLEFANRHLAAKDICVSEEVFAHLYDRVCGHTWYVQRILNKVFEVCANPVTGGDIDSIISTIIGEEEYNYQRQYSLLTANQQRLLKAVAAEKSVTAVNAKEFLQRHMLGAASSVNRALDYLTDNEFIIETPQGYQIYDRFFAVWLRHSLPTA